jgi:hypothetical protein
MLSIIKKEKKPSEIKEDVLQLKTEFKQIRYGFQSVEEAKKHL